MVCHSCKETNRVGGTKIVNTGDNFSGGFLCNTAKIPLLLGFTKQIRRKKMGENVTEKQKQRLHNSQDSIKILCTFLMHFKCVKRQCERMHVFIPDCYLNIRSWCIKINSWWNWHVAHAIQDKLSRLSWHCIWSLIWRVYYNMWLWFYFTSSYRL